MGTNNGFNPNRSVWAAHCNAYFLDGTIQRTKFLKKLYKEMNEDFIVWENNCSLNFTELAIKVEEVKGYIEGIEDILSRLMDGEPKK